LKKGFHGRHFFLIAMLEVWSNIYIYHEAPSGQCNFLKDDSIRAMYFFKMAPADQLKIALADQLKIAPSEKGNFFKMAPAE